RAGARDQHRQDGARRAPRNRRETDEDETARYPGGLTDSTHAAMIARPSGRRLSMKIGFIGTGTMGQPMLANLLKKGHAVVAYDVVEAALEGAVKRGAARAGSAAEAARVSELVITMLPSSPHVEAAYLGAAGILEGIARGRLCVDMSTIDPAASRRVAEAARNRAVRFIDAPVSGGVPRAEDGTLAIMVGGDARDVEEARPVLACLGANIIHVGHLGPAGSAAPDLRVPVFVAPAAQQVLRLASSHGLGRKDFSVVYEFLKPSSSQAPV